MDEDEDEDMPLLPRSRRRLLDKGEEDDMSPGPPPLSLARGTRGAPSQTPVASQAPPRRATATQRQLRETSVNSDTSSVGRSTRNTKAAPSTQTRKGRAPAIVIEESEDEVNRDLGPARSSTGTGTGIRGKGSKAIGVSGSGSGFGDDEASSMATGTATRGKTQSSLGTGRRRLVVDDDDDGEMVSLIHRIKSFSANEIGLQGGC